MAINIIGCYTVVGSTITFLMTIYNCYKKIFSKEECIVAKILEFSFPELIDGDFNMKILLGNSGNNEVSISNIGLIVPTKYGSNYIFPAFPLKSESSIIIQPGKNISKQLAFNLAKPLENEGKTFLSEIDKMPLGPKDTQEFSYIRIGLRFDIIHSEALHFIKNFDRIANLTIDENRKLFSAASFSHDRLILLNSSFIEKIKLFCKKWVDKIKAQCSNFKRILTEKNMG